MHIDYPFHFDGRGRTARTTEEDHVRDMIEQFLFTNTGERVNRPNFGSGLNQLIFAPNSAELATALQHTVQAGLQQWLGEIIEVRSLEVVSDDAVLRVDLQYAIRSTQEARTVTFEREVAS
jgi:phage baseplate assembly protein W